MLIGGAAGRNWEHLSAAARNTVFRARAVRRVCNAITGTASRLEAAGRPGIRAYPMVAPKLCGWRVDFHWPELASAGQLRTPPHIPVDHLGDGTWAFDLAVPDTVLLAAMGRYFIATQSRKSLPWGMGTVPIWQHHDIEEFADGLFPGQVTYREDPPGRGSVSAPMSEHADPAAYMPFVESVADCAVAAFRNLGPG